MKFKNGMDLIDIVRLKKWGVQVPVNLIIHKASYKRKSCRSHRQAFRM